MFEWVRDAANEIVFVFVDFSNTEVTGLGTSFDLELRKPGGSFVPGVGEKAELGDGWYRYTATPGEADTPGAVAIKANGAGAVQQNMVAIVTQVPGLVWGQAVRTLTMSSASVAEAVAGTTIVALRGDTLTVSFAGLGDLSGYTTLDFSVKARVSDIDTDAIIWIRKNSSGMADGLLRLLGGSADPTDGEIAIVDLVLGSITVVLEATSSVLLVPQRAMVYEIQLIRSGQVQTLSRGRFDVVPDALHAIV